ncbi:hypothetical protein TYRP_004246 [Tyrophagus putrescentiae]|nr:hypothetical protein TYRP_004246 [Tyrophagus putrescentiae]
MKTRFVNPKKYLFGQRLTLTTLGHCERPPTRAPLAPLARPESVDVHSAQVSSDLAALSRALLLRTQKCFLIFFKSKILVKLNQLSNGSPWRHMAHQNARRLGPRSLRSRGPRRRAFW